MLKGTILCLKRSEALRHAAYHLSAMGIHITDQCAPDVTHLLLPVPSFSNGDEYLAHLLAKLPDDVIISGGNLSSPLLEGYRYLDFLQDPYYLAENAAITARCAAEIVENRFGTSTAGKDILIIGWGRIGKCLGSLLDRSGASVTIAARRASDLAMIRALGCRSIHTADLSPELIRYDAIVNTVPELLLPDIQAKDGAILLELASKAGMTGENIIDGRGLPNKMAPSSSGKLIADTFVRLSL